MASKDLTFIYLVSHCISKLQAQIRHCNIRPNCPIECFILQHMIRAVTEFLVDRMCIASWYILKLESTLWLSGLSVGMVGRSNRPN